MFCCVYETRDDPISAWREYLDLRTWTDAATEYVEHDHRERHIRVGSSHIAPEESVGAKDGPGGDGAWAES